MYLPKFEIRQDIKKDKNCMVEFSRQHNPSIDQFFPGIENDKEALTIIDNAYKNNLKDITSAEKFLQDNVNALEKIAETISQLLDCSWDGIKIINIIPSVCPVCPRFIETNTFLVAYFFNRTAILRICAHEMTHFLYFKKQAEVFANKDLDPNYPSQDWLISEIVAPVIVNNKKIQALVNDMDSISLPNHKIVSDDQINQIVAAFNPKNFRDFISTSKNILNAKGTD
jgi:hypothetical protein